MRKTLLCFFSCIYMLCMQSMYAVNQSSSLSYLENTFPKLTRLYKKELMNCHTHYIFAVDVSGSMRKYNTVVTPALQAFAKALPSGEQVSVIPFGTDAKENTPGLCCKLESASQVQVLTQSLTHLYLNDGYSKEFRMNTDITQAIHAVNNTILNNQEAQMNVVVIITDFLNDLPGVGEQKLTKAELKTLSTDFNNVTSGTYTRVVAMQLPKAGTGLGFCLDQLQESVFSQTSLTKRFDIIQAIKDQAAIAHWFEQLSREIMTEKLRAVIQLDNEKNLRPILKTEMDIDGNTIAEIHWTPNKLYKQIKIEATNTHPESDFKFKNNEEVWQITQDTVLTELELGRLEHKKWGFRPFHEKLNIGLSLPTDYDNELQKLSIDKPLQIASDKQSGWVFTFVLPFWLTVFLVVSLLIYVYLFIKCCIRNSKERFIGTVNIEEASRRQMTDNIFVKAKPAGSIFIGKGGNYGCDVPNANWTIKVVKKNPSPFLVWKKPAFQWSSSNVYIGGGRKSNGLIGRYGKNKKQVHLNCGSSSNQITHYVEIKIKNK